MTTTKDQETADSAGVIEAAQLLIRTWKRQNTGEPFGAWLKRIAKEVGEYIQ
jgi:hypothetical protein